MFAAALGREVKRNIGQARDGGNDIDVADLLIECKRRKTLTTIEGWLQQAQDAVTERFLADGVARRPVVVCRADQGESLVVLKLTDFLDLVGDDLCDRTSAPLVIPAGSN